MGMAKRILLFIAVNTLVIVTLSIILNIFNVRPYLTSYGLDYKSLMIFCLVWGMGGAFISLGLSKIMAKWLMGVKIINPNEARGEDADFVSLVHNLCRQGGLTYMPEVGIYKSPEPNAFATGPSQKRSLIAVSTGLLQRMSSRELEGVLSHEIAHIQNGDMVTMALIQGVVNAFVMFLARILAFALSSLGKNKNNSSSGSFLSYTVFVILFEITFMILGSMVVARFSRYREFKADLGGSRIAGKQKMIEALEALQRMQGVQDPKKSQASFDSLKISSGKKRGWTRFFASHPPLELRIQRLKESA